MSSDESMEKTAPSKCAGKCKIGLESLKLISNEWGDKKCNHE